MSEEERHQELIDSAPGQILWGRSAVILKRFFTRLVQARQGVGDGGLANTQVKVVSEELANLELGEAGIVANPGEDGLFVFLKDLLGALATGVRKREVGTREPISLKEAW